MTGSLPTLDDVLAAAARLDGIAHRTPVLTSKTLNERTGGSLFLKAECFQRAGAFKFRGAYNAIASLTDAERARGVATFSSGNHAQAVALASALHHIPSIILMPEDAPSLKVEATRGYGAEIVTYDRYAQQRTALGEELATERGMTLIPPFDHWDVIAGQGTAALELFEDAAPLDMLVVCVGGGGLISGCATVAKAQDHPVEVIGVEPEAGDDVRQSFLTGRIVEIPTPRTIADGQQTTSPGEKTFAVIREKVDDVVLVTDDEIVAAMRFVFERMNVVLEPSGASALAAIMAGHIEVTGKRVGVTLSGGNIGIDRFVELMAL
ncbi:MAG: threo-3-hydroxy-L-aspartate ammonia-lyase [Acidimicrobiia bacterium]|nr:threo-3-hydroxy-L-aspartate ammonia-lyase [Acidimicrobiia bacterium]